MDRTDLVRLRWRLTGAWFWPTFLTLTLIDAAVIHWLPVEGDSESAVGAWLIAAVIMLLATVILSPGLGRVMRWSRKDLPRRVARDYAATCVVLAVSVVLAIAGIVHHHSVSTDAAAVKNASQRAEAWIGTHAPPQFQRDMYTMSVAAVQAPRVYRSCVTDPTGSRYYCVVVNLAEPFGSGVSYSGTTSNQLLYQGAN